MDIETLENEIIPRLLRDKPRESTNLGDPNKVWVVLQYPDSLKVTATMLSHLLEDLRTYPDESVSYTVDNV